MADNFDLQGWMREQKQGPYAGAKGTEKISFTSPKPKSKTGLNESLMGMIDLKPIGSLSEEYDETYEEDGMEEGTSEEAMYDVYLVIDGKKQKYEGGPYTKKQLSAINTSIWSRYGEDLDAVQFEKLGSETMEEGMGDDMKEGVSGDLDLAKVKAILSKASKTKGDKGSDQTLIDKEYFNVKEFMDGLKTIIKIVKAGPKNFSKYDDTMSDLADEDSYDLEGGTLPKHWESIRMTMNYPEAAYEYDYDVLSEWLADFITAVNKFPSDQLSSGMKEDMGEDDMDDAPEIEDTWNKPSEFDKDDDEEKMAAMAMKQAKSSKKGMKGVTADWTIDDILGGDDDDF